jgi:DNA polymerase-4
MPSARARQVCPHLVIVRGEFANTASFRGECSRWRNNSHHISSGPQSMKDTLISAHNPHITPRQAAAELQAAVMAELGITVSLGIGKQQTDRANCLKTSQGRTRWSKFRAAPNANFSHRSNVIGCRASGPKLAARLRELGLRIVADIARAPEELLARAAGNYAPRLRQFAAGKDDRELACDRDDAKSYGMQETFDRNVGDKTVVLRTLTEMADDLMSRGPSGSQSDSHDHRALALCRYERCLPRHHLDFPTDLETDVYPLLPRLVRETWKRHGSVRLAGLRFTNVQENLIQEELPLDTEAKHRARQRDAVRLLETSVHAISRSARTWPPFNILSCGAAPSCEISPPGETAPH